MHAHIPVKGIPLFGILVVTDMSLPGHNSGVPLVPSVVVRFQSRGDMYGVGKLWKCFWVLGGDWKYC